ncbi:hypothetical protein F3Y22_tig00116954pilonHSYRG00106 [Hibiscus syriacus]|uniref:Uncharacterized protein n=1 Tax=Hibiscus syriacus TaxID=106335 RepID=A0A6A2XDT6_HIBSY|nr:hypothetical protein F3Y22_tig00116954pilonHSYRG00106 [Hibiscus syriacus]
MLGCFLEAADCTIEIYCVRLIMHRALGHAYDSCHDSWIRISIIVAGGGGRRESVSINYVKKCGSCLRFLPKNRCHFQLWRRWSPYLPFFASPPRAVQLVLAPSSTQPLMSTSEPRKCIFWEREGSPFDLLDFGDRRSLAFLVAVFRYRRRGERFVFRSLSAFTLHGAQTA